MLSKRLTKNERFFTFKVEQDHIDGGVCQSPTQCMTAMAIKEANPKATYVSVRTNAIHVTERNARPGKTVYKVYSMKTKIAKKIHHHDETQPGWRSRIQPFQVTLELIHTRVLPAITPAQRAINSAATKRAREARKALGLPAKNYGAANRIKGI